MGASGAAAFVFCSVGSKNGQDDARKDRIGGGDVLKCLAGLLLDLFHFVVAEQDSALPERRAVAALRLAVIEGNDHIPGSAAQGVDGPVGNADHVEVVAAPDSGHVVFRCEEMVAEPGEKIGELEFNGKHPLAGFPADEYVEFHAVLPQAVQRPANGEG